jgi:hypothetical protein
VRNRPVPREFSRRPGECSEFLALARRMSIPADVAIHEFMELGTRGPRPDLDDRDDDVAAELATVDG